MNFNSELITDFLISSVWWHRSMPLVR